MTGKIGGFGVVPGPRLPLCVRCALKPAVACVRAPLGHRDAVCFGCVTGADAMLPLVWSGYEPAAVSSYRLVAGNGRPIRLATKVVFVDGTEVKFMERMPKKEAIAQALAFVQKEAV